MSLSKYPLKRGEFTSVRAVKILSDQPARVKRFREGLYQDMLEEVYCNCTLKAGAVSIKAHLHICVESCPWILKYAKAHPNESTIILPDIVSGEHARDITRYIYTRDVVINASNVYELVSIARKLELQSLLDNCIAWLVENLEIHNCLRLYRLSLKLRLSTLKKTVIRFMLLNFRDIMKDTQTWILLNKSDMIYFIQSNKLNIQNDKELYWALDNWSRYQKSTKGLLRVLEPHVRFTHYPPRIPGSILLVLGGWSVEPVYDVGAFDCYVRRWYDVPELRLPKRRVYHGVCVIQNRIYIIGGYDFSTFLKTAIMLDPETQIWTELDHMETERGYVSTAVLDGDIYAVGGCNTLHQRLRSVERYNVKVNAWNPVPEMHFQRSDAAVAALNDRLYVVGGFDGAHSVDTAEYYTRLSSQWTTISQLTVPRSGLSVLVYHDELYAIAGSFDTIRHNTVEKYSETLNQWTRIAPLQTTRSNFAACILENKIIVCGGYDGRAPTDEVEIYDDKHNEWYSLPAMTQCLSGSKVAVLRGLDCNQQFTYYGKTTKRQKAIDKRRRSVIPSYY